MRAKIDELRRLLGAHDRGTVSMHMLAGIIEITTDKMWREIADSGDRAYVFLGPKHLLNAERRELDDGTVTYTYTFTIAP